MIAAASRTPQHPIPSAPMYVRHAATLGARVAFNLTAAGWSPPGCLAAAVYEVPGSEWTTAGLWLVAVYRCEDGGRQWVEGFLGEVGS